VSMTKEQAQAVVGLSGVVGGGAYQEIGRGTWEARQVRDESREGEIQPLLEKT